MKEETFFNSMDQKFYTKNPQELAIIGDLHEQITQKKNRNIEFYKNIALLCLNYIQELKGLKDENGQYILNEVITPELEHHPQELETKAFLYCGIDETHFHDSEVF